MIERLSSHWWLFLIRGILAVVLGLLMVTFPGAAVFTLAIFFGAYAFVDGIVAIAGAIRMNHADYNWVWLLLEGVLGVIVGVITFFFPGFVALWLVFLFGAWAVLSGIFAIVSAFRIRQAIANEILMILFGAISIVAGIAIYVFPLYGIFALAWTIAIYAILAGIFMIGLAFRLRRLHGTGTGTAAGAPA